MEKRVKFELQKKQVDFLRKKYSDVPIVKRVLSTEKNLAFDIPANDDSEFFLWLDEESVDTMNEDYEPTNDTRMIEGIIDFMHYQEEQNTR